MTEPMRSVNGLSHDEFGVSVEVALRGLARAQVEIARLKGAIGVRVIAPDPHHVSRLAEVLDQLPPIVVHSPTMTVVDGMHRLLATAGTGQTRIEAVLLHGTLDDAFTLAVRLNRAHGLPLSQQDHRAAIKRFLAGHADWSDRRIAIVAGVSPKTVSAVRRACVDLPELDHRVGTDGRSRPTDSVERREWARRVLMAQPSTPLRAVAATVGVSPATVHVVQQRLRGESPPAPMAAPDGQGPVEHVVAPEAGSGHPVAVFGGRPPAAAQASTASVVDTICNLRLDPSLRDNVAGRCLLRLLSTQIWDESKIATLAMAVPSHRAADIVKVARACAQLWSRFADVLESTHGQRPARRS